MPIEMADYCEHDFDYDIAVGLTVLCCYNSDTDGATISVFCYTVAGTAEGDIFADM